LLWIMLISVAIISAAGIFIARKYQEELKTLSINKINEIIDTKISVDELNVIFLRTFPFVSLEMNNATVWSSHSFQRSQFREISGDTLFYADKLYLQFSPLDMIMSRIRLKRVYANSGKAILLVDSNGNVNHEILKKNPEDQHRKDNDWMISLDAVKISNLQLTFINKNKDISSGNEIKDLLLKGEFSKSDFSLTTRASLKIISFERNGISYADNFDSRLSLVIKVKDGRAEIERGEFIVNTINLDTRGSIDFRNENTLNLQMVSRNFSIGEIVDNFPSSLRKKIDFSLNGRGDVALHLKGPFTRTTVPSVRSVYVFRLNRLKWGDNKINSVKLKGTYTNGKLNAPSSAVLKIEKFEIVNGLSRLYGSFELEDFLRPDISLNIGGSAELADFSDYLENEAITDLSGTIIPDLSFSTRLASLKFSKEFFSNSYNILGNIELKDFIFSYSALKESFRVNGLIEIDNPQLYSNLVIINGSNEINLRTKLQNFPEYLNGNSTVLTHQTYLNGPYINLTPYIEMYINHPENDRERDGNGIFKRSEGNIQVDIEKLDAPGFSLSEIQGDVSYNSNRIDAKQIFFNFNEGRVYSSIAVSRLNPAGFSIHSENELENIDLKELFQLFNNFGQENLIAENLEGSIFGDINFSASFRDSLKIIKNSILTEAALKIESGELINFEPLTKLSRFINIEELEHIRFSTLENSVLIKDGVMTIPEMTVKSNAFDLDVSGIHDFNNSFDYKMKVLLSEILANRKRNENYIMENERRASLYLSIAGTAKDYQIKYDRKEAINAIKADMEVEKQTMKSILREEFGWFKRDSALIQESPEGKRSFLLEWENDSMSSQKGSIKKKNKKKEEEIVFELEWDDDK